LQHNDDAAEQFPSLLMAVHCFSNTAAFHNLTNPQTEAFAFHQVLHHKNKLSEDETELLKSAKLIVFPFITNLVTIANWLLDLPLEKNLKVKHKYFFQTSKSF
jgi:hypothetical protein